MVPNDIGFVFGDKINENDFCVVRDTSFAVIAHAISNIASNISTIFVSTISNYILTNIESKIELK